MASPRKKPNNKLPRKKPKVAPNDPQRIAKTDPNKHSVMSLAAKIKERQRMNREALKNL